MPTVETEDKNAILKEAVRLLNEAKELIEKGIKTGVSQKIDWAIFNIKSQIK